MSRHDEDKKFLESIRQHIVPTQVTVTVDMLTDEGLKLWVEYLGFDETEADTNQAVWVGHEQDGIPGRVYSYRDGSAIYHLDLPAHHERVPSEYYTTEKGEAA